MKKTMKVGKVLRGTASSEYGFRIHTKKQEDAEIIKDAFVNVFRVLVKNEWNIEEE